MTSLIYGCMRIGGSWDGTPPDDDTRRAAFAALDAAWGAGYRIFDHADIYCAGNSERVFGEWLAAHPGLRSEMLLQSKCGIRLGDPVMYDFSRDHILSSVDGILERLGVERLDSLLLHRPDPLVEPEEVAAAFDELERTGKVAAFGVSNHSAMQIELLQRTLDQRLSANQMEVSLAHPDLITTGVAVNQREPDYPQRAADTVEYCRLHDITLQAWSPLAHGRYSGAGDKNAGDTNAEDNAATRMVADLARERGVSREAVVLAWIMRHPARIVPVVGSTNPERIVAAAQAGDVLISREEWYGLLQAARGSGMP